MDEKIFYDFLLSNEVAREMENTALAIHEEVITELKEQLQIIGESWQAEASQQFLEKCDDVVQHIGQIRDNLTDISLQISRVSRRMYLMEEENEQIISRKKQ